MTSQFRIRCMMAVGFLTAASLVAQTSVAAEGTPTASTGADSDTLQEVIVTASKRTESIQEVPVAISVLSADTLDRQGVAQFSDYMALVPGLAQNSTGAAGHGLVVLRGLSTGEQQTASTVSYLIDDVPFTANSSLAIGSLLTPDPDLTDIERIEVLKGPQGTLYGASALGGIIKIVSARPEFNVFSGDARVSGSSVDHGGTGDGVRASLNIPLVTDTAALRVSAFDRTDAGFMKNVQTDASDANKTEVSGGKLLLRVQPVADLTIDLSGMIQNLHSEGASTVYGDEVTLKPTYCRYCYAAAVGPVFDTQYRIAGMVVNWTLPAGTLTNSLSYGQYKDSETFDYTPSYGVINVLYGLPVPANTAVIGTLYPSMRKITEELRFATSRFGNFEGLAGLFYTHEHNEYDVNVTNRVPPTLVAVPPPFDNFITADTTPLYEEYAAFADLTYYFAPTLDFTVGGRYTHNDQHAASYGSGILNGGVVTRSEFESSEHPTTYLATLRYRPMTDLDLYARIATGYRPGGPQTLAGPNIPPSFKADTTRNYEIGAKGRWLEGRLTTNLALYYIAWNDIQLNELINGLQVQGNGGKAKSKGAEFDLAFLPVRGLTTQLSASYNRATTDVAVPIVGAQAGDTLPYAAKFNAAVTGDYEFPITPALKGDVGATYAYQGSRPTSWSMDPLNVPTFLPGYSTLALRTGVQWDKYSLQLRAENVTDKYAYETSSVGNIFPGQGSPAQSVLITPRTFVLEFNARF